jgi:hypothetical protein
MTLLIVDASTVRGEPQFAPCVPELVVEVLELVCSWLTTAQTTQTIHGPDSPHPYGFVD